MRMLARKHDSLNSSLVLRCKLANALANAQIAQYILKVAIVEVQSHDDMFHVVLVLMVEHFDVHIDVVQLLSDDDDLTAHIVQEATTTRSANLYEIETQNNVPIVQRKTSLTLVLAVETRRL